MQNQLLLCEAMQNCAMQREIFVAFVEYSADISEGVRIF